jgi:hypothetical protein
MPKRHRSARSMRAGEDRPDPRHSEPASQEVGSLPPPLVAAVPVKAAPAVQAKPEPKSKPAPAPRARRHKPAPPVTFASVDTMRRGTDIKTMDHDALRAYAAVLGVRKLDIENLSLERLRVNCMATLDERYAQLMED